MVKIYFQFLLSIFFLLCFFSACGTNQDNKEFRDAKTTDSLESYSNYLSKFPSGKYKKVAMQRVFSIEVASALNDFIKYTKGFETVPGSPKKAPSGVNYMSQSNNLISLSAKFDKNGVYKYIFDDYNIATANEGLASLAGKMKVWRTSVSAILNNTSKTQQMTTKERKDFYETINEMTVLWNKKSYPEMKKEFTKIQNNLHSYQKTYTEKQLSEFNTEYVNIVPDESQEVDKITIKKEMIAFRKECDNIGSHFLQLGNKKLVDLDLNNSLIQLNKYAVNIDSWPVKVQPSARQIINRIDEIVKMDIQDKSKLFTYGGDIALLISTFFNNTKELSGK